MFLLGWLFCDLLFFFLFISITLSGLINEVTTWLIKKKKVDNENSLVKEGWSEKYVFIFHINFETDVTHG